MVEYLMNRVQSVLRNEDGIETLEWIAMAFLIIVLLAVIVYPNTLQTTINAVITRIDTALTAGS